MNQELPDKVTSVSPVEVATALTRAWRTLWGNTPTVRQLFVLLAQWALETWWGKSCHWWNLGNAKWASGFDWCCFACGEELALGAAVHYAEEDPDHVHIVQRYTKNGVAMASCKFLPPHPMTRFKAFHSLDEAAIYYIGDLRRRFNLAWPAVLNGDPAGFAHQLKVQHYYTAPEHTPDGKGYADSLVSIFNGMHNHVPDFDPIAVPDSETGITDEDRARVSQLVSLTVEQMVNEIGHSGAPDGTV